VKKITSWVFLLALAVAVPVLAQPTLTASPNPLPAGTNVVTISWNAPGHASVDVHLSSPTGTVFAGADRPAPRRPAHGPFRAWPSILLTTTLATPLQLSP